MKTRRSTPLLLLLLSTFSGAHAFAPVRRLSFRIAPFKGPEAERPISERASILSLQAADADAASVSTATPQIEDTVLKTLESLQAVSNEYAETFGLGAAEAAFYGLFLSLRQSNLALGLKGSPFVLRHSDIESALHQPTQWPGFFTMQDLENALADDFLDAARGSTDNRKGWMVCIPSW